MIAATPIFRSRRLGHVNFFVDDLDKTTRFYRDVCGLALEFSEVGLKATFLGTGNTPHDVGCIETTKGRDRYGKDGHLQLPKEVGVKPGLNHLAWEVDNEAELVAGYERCQKEGVAIARLADHQIAHSIYMRDPDGNMSEFYVDTIRDWRKVLHGDLDLITSVWDPKAKAANPDPLYDPAPPLRIVESAPFHPHRLEGCTLASPDPQRLAAFYTKVAGLTPMGERDGAIMLRGTAPGRGADLTIVPLANGHGPGLSHFSLQVASAGALTDAERKLAAAGKALDGSTSAPGRRGVFLRDPDGQRVEMFCAAA
jgi:catechol 2,3-dioxygenase